MSRPRENPRKILEKISAYAIFKKLENRTIRLGQEIRIRSKIEVSEIDSELFEAVYWSLGPRSSTRAKSKNESFV